MHRPPPEKRHVSIPELLLTGIVLGALLGGIWAVYLLASRDKKIDAAVHQIDEIRQLDFTATDGHLLNPWGGKISSIHEDRHLILTLEDVPADACKTLAMHYTAEDENFISLKINDTGFGEGTQELISSNTTPVCTQKQTATMMWTFK